MFACNKVLFLSDCKIMLGLSERGLLEISVFSHGRVGKSVLMQETVSAFDCVSNNDSLIVSAATTHGDIVCSEYAVSPRIMPRKSTRLPDVSPTSTVLTRSDIFYTVDNSIYKYRPFDENRGTVAVCHEPCLLQAIDGNVILFSCGNSLLCTAKMSSGLYSPPTQVFSYRDEIRGLSLQNAAILCQCGDGIYLNNRYIHDGEYPVPTEHGFLFKQNNTIYEYRDGETKPLYSSDDVTAYRVETPPYITLGEVFPDTKPHTHWKNVHVIDGRDELKAQIAECKRDIQVLRMQLLAQNR